jgi:nucleotide-binding universal stress UspA family protein
VEEENMDVVVLSAHGYGGESRWPFGDVATNFIDYGRTPLLLVQDMPKHEPATVAITAESWGG